jgi:hypothetical protein
MRKALLLGVALVMFSLCALPVLAAPDPAASAAFVAIFAPAPEAGAQPQAQDAAARRGLPTKSTSTANCWNGSTVTCTGTSSSAVNSNCAGGQRGYCTGTTSGTINCPVCQTGTGCTATAVCSSGGSVSCTGSSPGNCFAVRNCYADCGGPLVWCPNHGSCPL